MCRSFTQSPEQPIGKSFASHSHSDVDKWVPLGAWLQDDRCLGISSAEQEERKEVKVLRWGETNKPHLYFFILNLEPNEIKNMEEN